MIDALKKYVDILRAVVLPHPVEEVVESFVHTFVFRDFHEILLDALHHSQGFLEDHPFTELEDIIIQNGGGRLCFM